MVPWRCPRSAHLARLAAKKKRPRRALRAPARSASLGLTPFPARAGPAGGRSWCRSFGAAIPVGGYRNRIKYPGLPGFPCDGPTTRRDRIIRIADSVSPCQALLCRSSFGAASSPFSIAGCSRHTGQALSLLSLARRVGERQRTRTCAVTLSRERSAAIVLPLPLPWYGTRRISTQTCCHPMRGHGGYGKGVDA